MCGDLAFIQGNFLQAFADGRLHAFGDAFAGPLCEFADQPVGFFVFDKNGHPSLVYK